MALFSLQIAVAHGANVFVTSSSNEKLEKATMESPEDFKEMLEFFEEHKISPSIDKCYPLEEAIEAQNYMESGNNFGKITLQIG